MRTSDDGQYVLIFDPVKKHFMLHRVDSTFDMNLVSAPWAQDASKIRSQYPQLDPEVKAQSSGPQKKSAKASKKDPTKAAVPRRKVEKAKKPKPPPVIREPTPEAPDEEDSDDGLTIEYPDAPANYQYKSTPLFERDPSEASGEDEDAEGEDDDEMEHNQDVDHLKLPSPANNNAGGMSDEDIELDLEAELEQALNADESSESEEE